MHFETMDWEAEARRVARAFRVRGHYEFRRFGFRKMQFVRPEQWGGGVPINADNALIRVWYHLHEVVFGYQLGDHSASIQLNWDGTASSRSLGVSGECKIPLAKGLFLLDLFTTEVETALQVSISAHEKLEWTLERERLMILPPHFR